MPQSIITVEAKSVALGRTQPVCILPPDRLTSGGFCYALYLLHGMNGDHESWPSHIDLPTVFAGLPVMAVMPSAENAFYMDSDVAQMETFLCDELVSDIDSRYPVLKSPQGRGLTGFSMGGYGALLLALRRPHLFGAAASHGGAVLTSRANREVGVKWELADQLYGTGTEGEVKRREHDILSLAQCCLSVENGKNTLQYSGPALYLDCGLDDFLYYASRELTQALRMLRVPYEYHESPGDHDWDYCAAHLSRSLEFHVARFTA